jgi:hypothetical protein
MRDAMLDAMDAGSFTSTGRLLVLYRQYHHSSSSLHPRRSRMVDGLSQVRSRRRSTTRTHQSDKTVLQTNPRHPRGPTPPVRNWRDSGHLSASRRIPVLWIKVGSALVVLLICWHFFLFYRLMENNVFGTNFRQELLARQHARGDFLIDPDTSCPRFPIVSKTKVHPSPLIPMTKEELEHQIDRMVPVRSRHTGSSSLVLQCPPSTACRGVVKVFRSKSTFRHVQRCLTLLKDSDITARLLYSDEDTLTLVEEEIAPSTLWFAPIPSNLEVQLLYIRCILLQYSIVHRDFTASNFVVHPRTGKLYIIDFSDAFVSDKDQGRMWFSGRRNLVNLFNLWWKWHNEDAQRQILLDRTTEEPFIQWKEGQ